MSTYVACVGRYAHAVSVAIYEHAIAGSTSDKTADPSITSMVKKAPPSGTLYTAASPAPAPHATRTLRCPVVRPNQPDTTLPDAAPISFGACSRPKDAPMAVARSAISPVPRHRRNERRASPVHMESSTSDFSPLVYLRSRYQAELATAPAISSTTKRRRSLDLSTACSNGPEL